MKTVKWLLVAILLMQVIQTAVLWFGLVIYPYEDDAGGDGGGVVLESKLSRPGSLDHGVRPTDSVRHHAGRCGDGHERS